MSEDDNVSRLLAMLRYCEICGAMYPVVNRARHSRWHVLTHTDIQAWEEER